MSIRLYFVPKPRDIPKHEKIVPFSVAEAVRNEVGSTLVEKSKSTGRERGTYDKVTPENWAKVAKYAAVNRVSTTIRHFKTKNFP